MKLAARKLSSLTAAAAVASAVAVSAALLGLGCSSKNTSTTPTSIDGGPFCPASLAAALDPKTSCEGEGFQCPIGYNCGSWAQQAYCTCSKGKFSCTTGQDQPIDSVDSAPCTVPGNGSDKECPGSQNGTEGQPCKTPGLQCFYQSATTSCPESSNIPNQDVCQCTTQPLPDGGPHLAFRCEIASCSGSNGSPNPPPPPPAPDGG